MKRTWTDEQLRKAVKNNVTTSAVMRELGLNPHANPCSVKKRINYLKIIWPHFLGRRYGGRSSPMSLNKIMVKNSTYKGKRLKKRLINLGLLKYKCYICGIKKWKNKPLVLIMDHINGVRNDNRQKNLRLVCPNCDSQLPTFTGRNIKCKKLPKKRCECGKKILQESTRCTKCESKERRIIKNIDKEKLIRSVGSFGYKKTGDKYGVSPTTVKRWLKRND